MSGLGFVALLRPSSRNPYFGDFAQDGGRSLGLSSLIVGSRATDRIDGPPTHAFHVPVALSLVRESTTRPKQFNDFFIFQKTSPSLPSYTNLSENRKNCLIV